MHNISICPLCQETLKRKSGQHDKACRTLASKKEMILKLYDEKISIEKLKKIIGLDCRTIIRFLRRNGREVSSSRNKVKHDFLDCINEEKMWWIGLMAADGSISKDGSISIYQSGENGRLLIGYLAKILGHTNKISKQKTTAQDSFGFSFRSEKILQNLEKFNVVNNKTKTYSLPEINNENLFKSFLVGYIDGDGSIGIYKTNTKAEHLTISFVGTPEFINQCSKKITIPHKVSSYPYRSVSEIKWTGENAVAFGLWLYENFSGYKYYKYKKFYESLEYLNIYQPIWSKKNKIRFQIGSRLFSENPMSLCKEFAIAFQTLYKWKVNLLPTFSSYKNLFFRIKDNSPN